MIKKYLIFTFIIFGLVFSVWANTIFVQTPAGGGPSYLFSENFDGSTDCYSGDVTFQNCNNTWAEEGSPDSVVYNSTLAGNDGTYNILLKEAGQIPAGVAAPVMTGGDRTALTSTYFMVNMDTDSTRPDPSFLFFGGRNEANSTTAWECRWAKTGAVTCYHGTVSGSVGTLSEDTWYHFWVDWTKGTGANGTLTVTVETSATKGAADLSITTGDGTSNMGRIKIYDTDAETTTGVYFDKIRIDDESIGSTPP